MLLGKHVALRRPRHLHVRIVVADLVRLALDLLGDTNRHRFVGRKTPREKYILALLGARA